MDEKEILIKANRNGKKISEIWVEISKKYAGEIIAVENGEIIENAKTSEELIETLKNKNKDISSILIISVPAPNVAYIL